MLRPLLKRGDHPQRGAILLLTLLVASMLSLLAASFTSTVGTHVERARESNAQLHAELAVESGVAFVRRQLDLDPEWPGLAAGESVTVGDSAFAVEVASREVDAEGNETLAVRVSGLHGTARSELEATFGVWPGSDLSTKALILLGGESTDIGDTTIVGGMVIVDEAGKAIDWVPDPASPEGGNWETGRPAVINEVDAPDFTVMNGEMEKFTERLYSTDPSVERVITIPVRSPKWNLDSYLDPGPGRIIRDVRGGLPVISVRDEVVDETVVYVLDPGQDLDIRDGRYYGGMVVHVPQDADLRGAPRNRVDIIHPPSVFGGGPDGMHEHIGLIAPASVVKINCSHGQTFRGFNYWGSSEAISSSRSYFFMEGMWIIHNNGVVRGGLLTWNPAVAQNLPPGFEIIDVEGGLQLRSLREVYELPPLP